MKKILLVLGVCFSLAIVGSDARYGKRLTSVELEEAFDAFMADNNLSGPGSKYESVKPGDPYLVSLFALYGDAQTLLEGMFPGSPRYVTAKKQLVNRLLAEKGIHSKKKKKKTAVEEVVDEVVEDERELLLQEAAAAAVAHTDYSVVFVPLPVLYTFDQGVVDVFRINFVESILSGRSKQLPNIQDIRAGLTEEDFSRIVLYGLIDFFTGPIKMYQNGDPDQPIYIDQKTGDLTLDPLKARNSKGDLIHYRLTGFATTAEECQKIVDATIEALKREVVTRGGDPIWEPVIPAVPKVPVPVAQLLVVPKPVKKKKSTGLGGMGAPVVAKGPVDALLELLAEVAGA